MTDLTKLKAALNESRHELKMVYSPFQDNSKSLSGIIQDNSKSLSGMTSSLHESFLADHTVWTWCAVNVLLWLSYLYEKPNGEDFGEIKGRRVRRYLLIWASFAYLMNFVDVYYWTKNKPDTQITLAILIYYLFQILFIPVVRKDIRMGSNDTPILLSCAFLSMLYIFILRAIDISIFSQRNLLSVEMLLMLLPSLIVVYHTLVNDVFYFGLHVKKGISMKEIRSDGYGLDDIMIIMFLTFILVAFLSHYKFL